LFSDPRLRIGNGVYLGSRCDIGYAHIEPDCVIGSGVHILSGQQQHRFDDPDVPIRDQGGTLQRVSIGRDTWIGNNAVIAADVGAGCVIGAGSVVVKPVPDRSVAAGNPARILRTR
jgi:acetyltransferase-like isoleucine patch superfamily enzyme